MQELTLDMQKGRKDCSSMTRIRVENHTATLNSLTSILMCFTLHTKWWGSLEEATIIGMCFKRFSNESPQAEITVKMRFFRLEFGGSKICNKSRLWRFQMSKSIGQSESLRHWLGKGRMGCSMPVRKGLRKPG